MLDIFVSLFLSLPRGDLKSHVISSPTNVGKFRSKIALCSKFFLFRKDAQFSNLSIIFIFKKIFRGTKFLNCLKCRYRRGHLKKSFVYIDGHVYSDISGNFIFIFVNFCLNRKKRPNGEN